jgi:hypothetical protein
MNWFGSTVRVEQFEDGDRLRFRVTNERRIAALLLPTLAGLLLFFYAWQYDAGWLVLLAATALIALPVWRWFQVRVTELRVTEVDLVVEGDLDSSNPSPWVLWSEITSLHHLPPIANDPEGLYASKGLSSGVCLVPGVNEGQADRIIQAIYHRFPYVAMAAASETTPLGSLN